MTMHHIKQLSYFNSKRVGFILSVAAVMVASSDDASVQGVTEDPGADIVRNEDQVVSLPSNGRDMSGADQGNGADLVTGADLITGAEGSTGRGSLMSLTVVGRRTRQVMRSSEITSRTTICQ